MLSALLGENFGLVILVSSLACGLLGFILARLRGLNGWMGAAVAVCVNLLVLTRSHLLLTKWVTAKFSLPYSEGAAVIVLVAAAALLLPFPLIALRSRKHATTALAIIVATTVLAVLIHVRLGDLYQHFAPAPPANDTRVFASDKKALPAAPVAPKPPAPVETEVLRLVTQHTPLYLKRDGIFIPSTHRARTGSWVLILPPGPEPRDEDFVEVLLATPDGAYVPNWSPRGFVRSRTLGQLRSRPKPSGTATPQQERRMRPSAPR